MKRLFLLLLIPLLLVGCETVNHRDREVLQSHNVPPNLYDKMLYGDPLSLADVITLSHCGVPAGLIMHYLDATDAAYRLRKADVEHLRSEGVDEDVISYMLSTSAPYGPPPAYAGPPPGAYPYPYYPYDYYYGGAYGGPVVVVGGAYHHWGWGGGGWGHYHHD